MVDGIQRSEEEINRLYLENEKLVEFWIKKKYGNNIPGNIESDLYSEGCRALYKAAVNYEPNNESGAEFGTYASECIKMSFLSVWEKARKTLPKTDDTIKPPKPDDFIHEEKEQGARIGSKRPDRLALQFLEVLRMWSDEKHTLTQQDIIDWHYSYCYEKYGFEDTYDRRTVSTVLKNMILELDPYEYNGTNQGEYKLLYDGYDKDLLKKILERGSDRKSDGDAKITDLSYAHVFSYGEMDQLIEAVCFSDMLTDEEKTVLAEKIFATASEYYTSPFWDKENKKLLFNPTVVHGRLSRKFGGNSLAGNNSIVQKAILNRNVISFKFNHYTENGELEPNKKTDSGDDRIYVLRPYHLVVYHDNYYCLGFHEGSNNIYHYRVDLMSDIELVRDEDGNPVTEKMVPVDDHNFVGDFWNPGNYMAEHIYMAYGKPRDIKIEIDNRDNKSFTFIHDWFGDHYEVLRDSRKASSPDHIIISVKADPHMLVHWAMQYAGLVEVLDEEVRALIKSELDMMRKKYE